MNEQDRKALAVGLREQVTWERLRAWAMMERETLLNDLAQADPNHHGELAYIAGRLSYVQRQIKLEQTVTNLAGPAEQKA